MVESELQGIVEMNFPVLPKPPTSKDEREIYRWNYLVCELLNGLRSIILEHDKTQSVELADLTQTDSDGYKHITNAMGNKWEEHVDITDGNPHGTDWDMLEDTATYIPMNTSPAAVPTGAGIISWNTVDGCLDIQGLNGTTLQAGQELYFYGKASGAIANGDLCMFAGAQGDHILMKKVGVADIPTIQSNPQYLIGVASNNIANGEYGYVTWFGKVNDVYTDTPNNQDTGDWAAGDILYFSNTTGQMTNVEPNAPDVRIAVAAVIKEQTGASETGKIIVRPTWRGKLVDLDDVDGVVPSVTGQFLYWNQANSVWEVSEHMLLYDAGKAIIVDDDLTITCSSQKTLKLTEPVWQDIDFPIIIRTTGAGIPTLATLYAGTYGNITAPQWQVNDSNVCESQEFVHMWQEATDCHWHIHLTTNGLDATDRYVRFGLSYGYAPYSGAPWTFTNLDSGDLLIPANTADKTMMVLSLGTFTPTGGKIGGHAIAILKRITATGTAPTGNPWIPMLQMHVKCDTGGSRQIGAK